MDCANESLKKFLTRDYSVARQGRGEDICTKCQNIHSQGGIYVPMW